MTSKLKTILTEITSSTTKLVESSEKYVVRPAQTIGQWVIQTYVGSPKKGAYVTVAIGTEEECRIAARAWNSLKSNKVGGDNREKK